MVRTDIITYIPVYNDLKSLQRAVKSVRETVNSKILVIGGRFINFPQINNSDYSTDGTIEWCSRQPDIEFQKIEPCNCEDKWNFARDIARAQNYQWMLVLESDGYLKGELTEEYLKETAQFLQAPTPIQIRFENIMTTPPDQALGDRQTRLFYQPGEIEVRHRHWWYYNRWSSERLRTNHYTDKITLFHDSSLRDADWEERMLDYQKINMQREDSDCQALGLE